MKILNLYAGIGGNRDLWDTLSKRVEITAVEIEPSIAKIYKEFYPNDKVIVGDAHKYLLQHFKEFDFIWSSPPCPTHSRINNLNYIKEEQGQEPKYPDMRLYEEIILLTHWFKGKWVVENVVSYYAPLIKPYRRDSHYFWCNFVINNSQDVKRYIREHLIDFNHLLEDKLKSLKIKNKEQVINNMVKPSTGLFLLKSAFIEQQKSVGEFTLAVPTLPEAKEFNND